MWSVSFGDGGEGEDCLWSGGWLVELRGGWMGGWWDAGTVVARGIGL